MPAVPLYVGVVSVVELPFAGFTSVRTGGVTSAVAPEMHVPEAAVTTRMASINAAES